MKQSRRTIGYFGSRRRVVSVGDVKLDVSWSWDFKNLSIACGGETVLSSAERRSLLDGVTLKVGDEFLDAKLTNGRGFGESAFSVRHRDTNEVAEIVDYCTRMAKIALLIGSLGLVYLLFGILYPASLELRMACFFIAGLAFGIAAAPMVSSSRIVVASLLLSYPAILLVTVGVFIIYIESVPLKLTLALVNLLSLFRDSRSFARTWFAFKVYHSNEESGDVPV